MMSLSEGFKSLRGEFCHPVLGCQEGAERSFGKRIQTLPPDVSIRSEVIGRPPGREGGLGRLRFDCGVEALDLGFEAANFVLEFEDTPDPGDVDPGVGQGGDLT